MSERLINFSLSRPVLVYWLLLVLTIAAGALIVNIEVDTDPENMLSPDEPARVFHNQVKSDFMLSDIIVVGAVAREQKSIFNQKSLADLKRLSDSILKLEGVKTEDVNSLSTIDNIEQADQGTIRFEWMMPEEPVSESQAQSIGNKSLRLPFVVNSLVSGDQKAATIYVPILDKNESYRIAQDIRGEVAKLSNSNDYYITGLPVAEDTFGFEMFVQMGISAPLAAAVIYLLMLYFFRSASLVAAPMVVAMSCVIIIMGAMIGLGYTVHIMSSMIPIFLMPIAVVDSVHVMSEFADRYKPGERAEKVIREVTGHLFQPMLFTSVTSAAGFFSLAITPIPPVQIFGVFVGCGILLAFLVTIFFVPAYVSRMSESALVNMQSKLHSGNESKSLIAKTLPSWGRFSVKNSKLIVLFCSVTVIVSVYGIFKIQINDNPVRWFKQNHEIRIADRILNQHFAGTYDAHLVFDFEEKKRLQESWSESIKQLANSTSLDTETVKRLNEVLKNILVSPHQVLAVADDLAFEATEKEMHILEKIILESEKAIVGLKKFTEPEMLAYIEKLQAYLLTSGYVGKSNSVVDLIKTVNRELRSGDDRDFIIPDSQAAVAQTLLQFQSSHRPQDLWHFVTPDYTSSLVWLQLTSGDNQHMAQVVETVNQYIVDHPLPSGVSVNWAGKAYLNLIWQDKMVSGMADSLMSAFVIVLVMMIFLFRSVIYGLLAMLPLSITIVFMYGMIGWTGKYYDMPIAVLSALTLGLSVDFAIHFIERTRTYYQQTGSWNETLSLMFKEPATAISRNALVIALGFTPLLLAPLVPYITVGAFLATIMAVSAMVTIIVLPASFNLLKVFLFKTKAS
ncbi:RND family transporter [Aliikangiella sp. G2MR2-5]|uniref:efflux RND transporter permease subunit n=1 Tax=Aliikangiella sp. G2MR2-5 TaxID=2788943 RepID=UPI0018A8EA8C|nr:MMPL family transporter [Aliikangiella sp. G2MR2-5]